MAHFFLKMPRLVGGGAGGAGLALLGVPHEATHAGQDGHASEAGDPSQRVCATDQE